MIPFSGTFDYEAEFTIEGFRDSDIVLHGTDRSGENIDRLVGLNPMIRFWNGRLVIVASGKRKSTLRNVSFPIGDAVTLTAHPGDQLYLIRTGEGGIGMSLLRQQRLILAAGAITEIPLGRDMQAIRGSEGTNDWDNPAADNWLEFRVRSEQLNLREREVTEIGGYHIYIERCWKYGEPGTDECVSVSVADDSAMKIATMRSGILLGNGSLKMTDWDSTECFTEL
jgi:hypothetical protein